MIKASMVAGEPFEVTFTVLVGGVPDPDFANFTAKIDLRKNNAQGSLVQSWKNGAPEMVINNAEAKVTLTIPANETNGYQFGLGFMDLLLLDDSNGRRSAALQIDLYRGVTR